MTDLRMDDSGDIWYEDGLIDQVDERDELEQSLLIAFRTGLGEYAFDTEAGVGYRTRVTPKDVSDSARQAEIARVALGREGVTSVREITIETEPVTRDSTIDVRLDTIYGEVTISP